MNDDDNNDDDANDINKPQTNNLRVCIHFSVCSQNYIKIYSLSSVCTVQAYIKNMYIYNAYSNLFLLFYNFHKLEVRN